MTYSDSLYILYRFSLTHCHLLLSFACSLQALKGQAIDRHLLGLKLQAIEEGLSIPKIFMDTAYGLATHWKLRTGQVCMLGVQT